MNIPTFGTLKMRAQGHNALGQEKHKMPGVVRVIPITDFYDFIEYSKKSGNELFILKKYPIQQASVLPHMHLSNVPVTYHYQNRIKIHFNKSYTKSKQFLYRHVSP